MPFILHLFDLSSVQFLETLIDYNRCDTVNLFKTAEIIFDKLGIKSGFIRGDYMVTGFTSRLLTLLLVVRVCVCQ